MSHCAGTDKSPVQAYHSHNSINRRFAISIGLNALIVVVEIAGGLLSGSLSLLSDAMHNLGDVAALTLALVARILARRPPSLKHTFGLGRLEVFAAMINSATLLIASTLICHEAVQRLMHPAPIQGGLMLIVACAGLLANLASMLMLRGHDSADLNVHSAFLHLLQDTVSSVVVVLVALFASWRLGPYLDPMASILIVVLILRGSWRLLVDTMRILLEGTPPGVDLAELKIDIESQFAVRDLHHVHIWELSSGYRLLTAHVRLGEMSLCRAEALLAQVRAYLASRWSIDHATLEPEINGCQSTELLQSWPAQGKRQREP